MPGASHPILQQALAVQSEGRDILTKKVRGQPLDEAQVCAWMDARRALAETEVSTPIDALAVAHGMLQAVDSLPRFAEDPEGLEYIAGEIILAASGLVQYLETCSGVTRELLGLHDDYIGPRKH